MKKNTSSKKYRVIGKGSGRIQPGDKLLVVKHNYIPDVTTYYQESVDETGVRHQWYMLDEEIQAMTIEGHSTSDFALDQGYTPHFRHLDLIVPFIGSTAAYLFTCMQSMAFKSNEGQFGEFELSAAEATGLLDCSKNTALKNIDILVRFGLIRKISQKLSTEDGTTYNNPNLYKIPRYFSNIPWNTWMALKKDDNTKWEYPKFHKEQLFERIDKFVSKREFNFDLCKSLIWDEGFLEFLKWFQIKYQKLSLSSNLKTSAGARFKLDQVEKYITRNSLKEGSSNFELGSNDGGSSNFELGQEKGSSNFELGQPGGSSKFEPILLKDSLLKDSIIKHQSVRESKIDSEAIQLAISKNKKLTDRLTDIEDTYLAVKGEKGYSDALFISTLKKAATARISVPFGNYLLKSMINNLNEQAASGSAPATPKHKVLPDYVVNQSKQETAASQELTDEQKRQAEELLRKLGEWKDE